MGNNKKDKIVWIEDDIIMTTCVAGLGEEKAIQFIDEFSEALDKFEENGKAVIDATSGKATISAKIRKKYVELGKKIKADKVVVFGMNTLQRTVASFVIKAIPKMGIKELKFLKTREEALKWIKA